MAETPEQAVIPTRGNTGTRVIKRISRAKRAEYAAQDANVVNDTIKHIIHVSTATAVAAVTDTTTETQTPVPAAPTTDTGTTQATTAAPTRFRRITSKRVNITPRRSTSRNSRQSDNATPKFEGDARILIYQKMLEACEKNPRYCALDETTRKTIVRRLERSCYMKVYDDCERDCKSRSWQDRDFVNRYSSECSKILANLDCESSVGSTHLLDGLIDGTIDPKNVATMKASELCPDASMEERDNIATRKNQKLEKKYSDKYKCVRCGARQSTYVNMAMMASDEITVRQYECVCGHRWVGL